MPLEILKPYTRDTDRSDARYAYRATAINRGPIIDINLPPATDHNFIPRTDDIVRRHRDTIQRRKCRGDILEKSDAKNRKITSQRLKYEFLKFMPFLRR